MVEILHPERRGVAGPVHDGGPFLLGETRLRAPVPDIAAKGADRIFLAAQDEDAAAELAEGDALPIRSQAGCYPFQAAPHRIFPAGIVPVSLRFVADQDDGALTGMPLQRKKQGLQGLGKAETGAVLVVVEAQLPAGQGRTEVKSPDAAVPQAGDALFLRPRPGGPGGNGRRSGIMRPRNGETGQGRIVGQFAHPADSSLPRLQDIRLQLQLPAGERQDQHQQGQQHSASG